MSRSRVDNLPGNPKGLHKLILKLRYHEQSRQWFAVLFCLVVSLAGSTTMPMFIAGTVLIVVGEAVRLWASGHVKKNKVLATDGPYAFVRHPLYVGNILVVLGFSMASMLWWAYALMIFLLWFYYPPAISYEDNKLKSLFGDAWVNWSRDIHALIPSFKRKPAQGEPSEWSFKQSMMQNGEPVIAAYLVLCLYLLLY
jgi:protein-S-isoprenylcysteine O-methyltransferase Ste14